MQEKKYQITMMTPLGNRKGYLYFRNQCGALNGWIDVLTYKNEISGTLHSDGQIYLSGQLQTIISTMPFQARGAVSGKQLLLNLKTEQAAFSVLGEEISINE